MHPPGFGPAKGPPFATAILGTSDDHATIGREASAFATATAERAKIDHPVLLGPAKGVVFIVGQIGFSSDHAAVGGEGISIATVAAKRAEIDHPVLLGPAKGTPFSTVVLGTSSDHVAVGRDGGAFATVTAERAKINLCVTTRVITVSVRYVTASILISGDHSAISRDAADTAACRRDQRTSRQNSCWRQQTQRQS